jgi:hypothetical protein
METKEKTNNQNKCCGTIEDKQEMTEMMDKCCEGMHESGDCGSKMEECMKRCRWFPLIPVIAGIFLLLMSYYLNAEVIRILWMTIAGLIIFLGIVGLIMVNKIKGTSRD